ncbi:hypothetical protein BDN72DRAFT_866833 [Pluteus cervinus]|uniref:Uncharacterized protein n=1 Tax=Pluteus cervinus TaxID=181527 RepID=A0ACD3BGZ8_9AGAR|nr:hypothetical protein BDN72DRAFT_866833 [Pluteus cervinus]
MSLADLTRNSFQNGLPSVKVNSVLVLFRSYPGDPDLLGYLKRAIQEGLLSLPVFVATFLQAVRSPDLHTPATLDSFCRTALDAHYKSGLPPLGSIVRFGDSPMAVFNILQDGLFLLRTAHSLSISHFHQLPTSASELVILLLSCVRDLSFVPPAQAMVVFADVTDLLQNFRLNAELRQVLETFMISLNLVIGDDAKAVGEAQLMHSIQLGFEKHEPVGPNSEADIISIGLLLHHLVRSIGPLVVSYRGHCFGSGTGHDSIALLAGLYRWAAWTPLTFYTQLFVSALTCLSQSAGGNILLWKAFVLGRVRVLLGDSTQTAQIAIASASDTRIRKCSVNSVLQHTELIMHCDHTIAQAPNTSSDSQQPPSIAVELMRQLVLSELLDLSFATQINPNIPNILASRFSTEAQDAGSYLEGKIFPDHDVAEFRIWRDKIWRDPSVHGAFSEIFMKLQRFSSLTTSLDVEGLSHLCKLLYTYDSIMDILAFHIRIPTLIFHAVSFLEDYDCETVGDPQTAMSHLGDVVLFAQYAIVRSKLDYTSFTSMGRTVSARYLRSTDVIHAIDRLEGQESVAFTAWSKALFDSNSEGIDDNILRSTHPKILLRTCATIISNAIRSHGPRGNDEVLMNGISYFTGPLLSWTLVGVVRALLTELERTRYSSQPHLEVLKTLLMSSSCPRPVFALCGPRVLSLITNPKAKPLLVGVGLDVATLSKYVMDACRLEYGGSAENKPFLGTPLGIFQGPLQEQAKQAIKTAIGSSRSAKAPDLDVERCLKVITPVTFLNMLWAELVMSATVGDVEICRRIATYVLTIPRPNLPPLLPIFLHNVLPALLMAADHQQATDQSISIDLMVAIMSSALSATLHLEWAYHMVSHDRQILLGQTSTAMVRRVIQDLRIRTNSQASKTMTQRLAASQTFATNFPMFLGDLAI